MTKYIQGKDGKFAGSIGDGKTAVPTASLDAPVPFDATGAADNHDYDVAADYAALQASTVPAADPAVQLRPLTREEAAEGARVAATAVSQMGKMNLLSISGGRVQVITDRTFRLPVSNGYNVEITLEPNDTYTVRRILVRKGLAKTKGEVRDVYAEELGETAYRAHAFHNGEFPDEV